MNVRKIPVVLFLVGIVAIFAWMVLAVTTLDATPRIVSPANYTNYSGNLLLNATIAVTNEDGNVTNMTFYFNSSTTGALVYEINVTPYNEDLNNTFNVTINTASLIADGFYNVTVEARNSTESTSWNSSFVNRVQIDNTNPLVTINTPTNDTFLGSVTTSLVFNATIADAGVGVHITNLSNSSGGAYTYATKSNNYYNLTIYNANLTEGRNDLRVWANDTLGNTNNSKTVTVWLDTAVPTVAIFTPANYTWTTDTTPDLVYNFTDNTSPNASCELFIDGTRYGVNSTVLNNTQTTWTANASLSVATHTWYVNCTDLGSNLGTSGTTLANKFTLSVVAVPSLTLQTNNTWIPATGATNYTANGTAFTFSFTSGLMAAASCELYFTNSTGSNIKIGLNSTTLNATSTTIYNNISLTAGQNRNWYINCTNSSTYIISETRKLNVDFTAPTVAIFTPANYTWTTDTTPDLVYNFTDNTSPNASCELFIDGTRYGVNSTVLNNTQTTWTANASLSVATHTWYVNCTDFGSNLGTSGTTLANKFYLDVVNPINVSIPTNTSWTSETRADNVSFTFNFVSGFVNTTKTNNNVSCELLITNATGSYIGNGVNATVLNNTPTTIVNNRTLVNGLTTNWTVNCTYNGTIIQPSTGFYRLNVDNATPTVAVTSTPSETSATISVEASEITNCKLSSRNVGWDEMSPFGTATGTSHSTSVVSLTASTSYTYYVICQDRASNPSVSTSVPFTTTASTSGSGGGGAGGGATTAAAGQFAKETWASINTGETATVKVANGEIGVTEVSFAVDKTAYGAWVKVEKVESLPSNVQSFSGGKVYKNIQITESNVQKVLKDDKATIDFKVANTWLKESKLDKSNIALFRYADSKWVELKTSVTTDDGTYVHYTAETPGFSYFVIGQKTAKVTEEAKEEAVTAPPAKEEAPVTEEAVAGEVAEKANVPWKWLVPLFVVIILAVLLYLYAKKS